MKLSPRWRLVNGLAKYGAFPGSPKGAFLGEVLRNFK